MSFWYGGRLRSAPLPAQAEPGDVVRVCVRDGGGGGGGGDAAGNDEGQSTSIQASNEFRILLRSL